MRMLFYFCEGFIVANVISNDEPYMENFLIHSIDTIQNKFGCAELKLTQDNYN